MDKKDKAIVFFSTADMLFAVAQMIVGLKKTNKDNYDDIVIYHSGYTKDDMEKLYKIEKNIVFKKYDISDFEKEHDLESKGFVVPFLENFSHLSYVKYKIFELLDDYRKVLLLDIDMLVMGDMSEIFENEGMVFRNGRSFFEKVVLNSERLIDPKDHPEFFSGIPEDFPSPNEGLILVTDNIDHNKCIKDCYTFINTFAPYYESGIDGLCFAWAAYKNDIRISSLDKTVYNVFPKYYKKDSKIIHFMGKEKIWKNEFLQCVFPAWLENYHEAGEISGITGEGVAEAGCPGNVIAKKLNEERWLRFLKNTDIVIPHELKWEFNLYSETLYFHLDNSIRYLIKAVQWFDKYIIGLSIKAGDKDSGEDILKKAEAVGRKLGERYTVNNNNDRIEIRSGELEESETAEVFTYFYNNTHSVFKETDK